MFRGHPGKVVLWRLPRLLIGLFVMSMGISAMVVADLGLGPWDVLNQGITNHTGVAFGTVGILIGVVVMIGWIPLHERVGVGTILNTILVGLMINAELAVWTTPDTAAVRWLLMGLGPIAIALGAGLYIGTDLGPGPRDGLMTGLVARGYPTWLVRGSIELTVLVIGWALGGTVGIGTVWEAVIVGPFVHLFLRHFSLEPTEPLVLNPE
jgi:uncharacterized membrane protein YczE